MVYKIEMKRRGKTRMLTPSYKTRRGAENFIKTQLKGDNKKIKTANGKVIGTIATILGASSYKVVKR